MKRIGALKLVRMELNVETCVSMGGVEWTSGIVVLCWLWLCLVWS